MGCDIHLHTEIKIDGAWHHYSAPDVRADYDLFGFMAGVRGEGKPIAAPKGIPLDVSAVTRFEYELYLEDTHHPSWFNVIEIRALHSACPNAFDGFGSLFGLGWDYWCKYPHELPKGVQEIRFVFWFDN